MTPPTTPEEMAAEASCPMMVRKKPTNMGAMTTLSSLEPWTMVDTGDSKLYLIRPIGASTAGYEGVLNNGTYSFASTTDRFTKSCAPLPNATMSECNGACVNLRADRSNCGACGRTCTTGQVCRNSGCQPMCLQQTQLCGGVMVDVASNAMNCGGCAGAGGVACPAGEVCSGGVCSVPCAAACSEQYSAAACGEPREFSNKLETKVDFTLTGGALKGTYSTTQSYNCKDPGCPADFQARCPTCAQSYNVTGREVTNVTEYEPR